MSKEAPVILLVNSPQNSKTVELSNTNLLNGDLEYGETVCAFDRALKIPLAGSLDISRQYASVVHSVASFNAFAEGLRQTYPGNIYPPVDFKFMGHSIGEMASFVEAGILDIPTTTAILIQRQFITEHPIEAGAKYMLAAVGLDIGRYEAFLDSIRKQFQGKIDAVIANYNSPSEGVLSVKVAEDAEGIDGRSLANELSSLKEFKHPLAERFRVVCLPVANAFHSSFMKAEEGLFISSIESLVRAQTQRVIPGMVYSPMMPGWVDTSEQAADVILYQLTRPVHFIQAIDDVSKIPGLAAIVTADVKDIMPRLIKDNLTDKAGIPIFNIKNTAALLGAIDGCSRLCQG